MEIRRSRIEDLDRIMEIYKDAQAFMKQSGNPTQWADSYPKRSLIEEDISKGQSYVCTEGADILAVFCFFQGHDATYDRIWEGGWLNDHPYAVVHRIASGAAKGKGVASFCLSWCKEQYPDIRIDTHDDNVPMQKLLAKNGFTYCGRIATYDGSERRAYQYSRA